MKKILLAISLLSLSLLSAYAADSPWVGTWKFDPAKSKITGDTFTISKTKGGLYHFSDGSTVNFDFGIDGKEYKSAYNHTTIWTAAGANAWDSVTKADGKELWKIHRKLSADGKTQELTISGTKPDGTPYKDKAEYTRLSGTGGLVGKWQSTKADVSSPDSVVISATADGMRWESPGQKQVVEGKAGIDLPVSGPTTPPNTTFNYKLQSPQRISYVVKFNGKPDTYGVQTLAADGKSYKDVSWNPGKENEKSISVFVKQ
jgi:hypothetical protein